jgi:trigger factor
MNITRENKDALNAVVTINIEKKDYAEQVEKILSNYRKSANIPGFRKGQVPMGLVKKNSTEKRLPLMRLIKSFKSL